MALPGVTFNIIDNALGITGLGNGQTQTVVGIFPGGTPNVVQSFASIDAMKSAMGIGPAFQAAAEVLAVAGGQVNCLPITPVIDDGYSYLSQSVSQVGVGSGTVAISTAPIQSISIKFVNSTHYTVQLGSGSVSAPTLLVTGSDVLIPGTLTFVTFGGSFSTNDTVVCNLDGTVSVTSGGGTATQHSLPMDNYRCQVSIQVAGGVGTMQFVTSVDNGASVSGSVLSTAKYQIPNTGIVLAFTGTFTKGDIYSFNSTQGDLSVASVDAAMDALATTYLNLDYFLIHIVGEQHSAAAARTLADAVDGKMGVLESKFKFVRALVECPVKDESLVQDTDGYAVIDANSADSPSTLAGTSGAFFTFVSNNGRVAVSADTEIVSSAADGIEYLRNTGYSCAARESQFSPARDGAESVPLEHLVSISRDEGVTPALDAARFITVESRQPLNGFYLTDVQTMALATSDYSRLANGRVMDIACKLTLQEALTFIQKRIPTGKNGTILGKAADQIEEEITAELKANMILIPDPIAVDVKCQVDRTINILSTQTLSLIVRVKPFGYAREIVANMGFAVNV